MYLFNEELIRKYVQSRKFKHPIDVNAIHHEMSIDELADVVKAILNPEIQLDYDSKKDWFHLIEHSARYMTELREEFLVEVKKKWAPVIEFHRKQSITFLEKKGCKIFYDKDGDISYLENIPSFFLLEENHFSFTNDGRPISLCFTIDLHPELEEYVLGYSSFSKKGNIKVAVEERYAHMNELRKEEVPEMTDEEFEQDWQVIREWVDELHRIDLETKEFAQTLGLRWED